MNPVDWQPAGLALVGGGRFAARHVWCVGRNYAEHAREMGSDPDHEPPIFFTKPATALVQAETIAYPAATEALHHEVELVAFLGRGGRDLSPDQAGRCVAAWAVGCDLTRRDVQARAKREGQPWALAKGFDQSGPLATIVPARQWTPGDDCRIELVVNGQTRQAARLGDMRWSPAALIARLSQEITLYPGDVIFTGTPAGVGPLVPGDRIAAAIDGLPELNFTIR